MQYYLTPLQPCSQQQQSVEVMPINKMIQHDNMNHKGFNFTTSTQINVPSNGNILLLITHLQSIYICQCCIKSAKPAYSPIFYPPISNLQLPKFPMYGSF